MCLPTFVLWILWRWRPDAVTCRNFVCYVRFLVFYVHLFVTAITCKNKTQSIQFQNSVELLTKRHTPLLSRKSTQQHSHFTYGCKWISISTLYISNWYGQRYIWSPCNSVVQLSIVKKRAMKPTLKGVNIILLVFSTFFHPKWITFSTGDVHKKKKSYYFVQIGDMERRTLLMGVNVPSALSTFIAPFIWNSEQEMSTMLLTSGQFRKNRHGKAAFPLWP